jgi:hypothetical protein
LFVHSSREEKRQPQGWCFYFRPATPQSAGGTKARPLDSPHDLDDPARKRWQKTIAMLIFQKHLFLLFDDIAQRIPDGQTLFLET